jgi:hypothetical protein
MLDKPVLMRLIEVFALLTVHFNDEFELIVSHKKDLLPLAIPRESHAAGICDTGTNAA